MTLFATFVVFGAAVLSPSNVNRILTGCPNASENAPSKIVFFLSSIFICIICFLLNSTVTVLPSNSTNRILGSAARILGVSSPTFSNAFRYSCGGAISGLAFTASVFGFGSAFGAVIILSVFWRRFTYKGAVAGVAAGAIVDVLWLLFLSAPTGVYELLPGFIASMIAAVVVTLLDKKPSDEVCAIFDKAMSETPEEVA